MADENGHEVWLRPRQRAEHRPALVCLPDSGGGASMFNPWREALPSWVAVRAVQLPGREDRWSEPPRRRVDQVVDDVASSVAHLEAGSVLLFGHSLGAVLAFELARELRRRAIAVSGLFVSGCRAPHVPGRFPPMRELPTADFATALSTRYDAAPELIENPELFDLLAPVIRADLELSETYQLSAAEPLECPMFVYRASDDGSVKDHEADEWRVHTTGPCEVRTYQGGHRFPRRVPSPLFDLLRSDLLAVLGEDAQIAGQLESDLTALWQEIVGVERVGSRDNFFTDLGGNSLLATRLISHVRARYGVSLPLKAFFSAPTVDDMSAALLKLQAEGAASEGRGELSQIQRGQPTKGRLLSDGGLTLGP